MNSVSIIIPIYNVEKYIERCIRSVMHQQNYDGYLECILVDDCTPDKSVQIAQSLIETYQGPVEFRIIRNLVNQGLSCSRNSGLLYAKGDYVFFLDSDDYISNDCIHCLSKQLCLNDCTVDMVVGNSYEFRHDKYWQTRDASPIMLNDHIDIMRKFLQIEIPMMAWNKLINRQFLITHNLFFAPKMVHEDELWSFQLYDVVKNVVLIPEVTYFYEQNANSIMTSSANISNRVEACHTLVYKMLESLENKELYIDKYFWGIHMYMLAEDMLFNNEFSSELVSNNAELRTQLLYRTAKDGRWVLFVFLFLTITPPFCYLVRFKWFRHKYHMMNSLFMKFALLFDFIHRP